jgi:folate-binding protein YgfZ
MTSPSSSANAPAEPAAPAASPAAPRRPVVLDYGDPAAEYGALRVGALLVDHGERDLWIFQGAQARETLTGLVTNDVVALSPGHGAYAAALTPKGRIVADLRILALADATIAPTPSAASSAASRAAAARGASDAEPDASWPPGAALLIDVPGAAAEGWAGVVRKFVNPRLAAYRRVTDHVRVFGVYGARARDAVSEAFSLAPSALAALAPYGHATVDTNDGPLLVTRLPDLGLDGFGVYAPAAAWDSAWERVARVAGVTPGGQRAYDVARIEAGWPAWGVDLDDTTIPQEANFDDLHAISYTKGCYTGQEVVARVHFRGHVNRHLRGLAYGPAGGPLTTGARLVDASGRDVGDVRSATISPRIGGIAIGMVRREVELGATLAVRTSDDGADERHVTVGSLPFPL